MDAGRWTQLQTLFHEALNRPEAQRQAFLNTACAGDADLLAEVTALLRADARGASLLDRDLGEVARGMFDGAPAVPIMAGPYRIKTELGRGGMGIVYLAERDDLGHQVAIKVLRDASLSPARRDRFLREQQTLAQLVHPSIARLYDASLLPDETPYFVMEYIEGTPITAYCEAQRCTLPERLRLFRAVGEAVQYAHRQAIIHRDLKPSNILVIPDASGTGSDGQVKLLDFGIAKHLENLDTPAEQTQTGLRLMTPSYAAPEQLLGEPVGVYTDVYALGVLLYQLLTGRLPFDLTGLTPGQAEARILEQEPDKPSRMARTRPDGSGSKHPMVSQRAWADLDVLCLTAMHKDPQRRYPTVEALLRDLGHFLTGKPLEARPDSWRYRSGKFLRRNRVPIGAAMLAGVTFIALVGYYTVQLTAARDAALEETARTQRIQRFMLGLFEGDEAAGPADSLRVRTLLERGMTEAHALDAEPVIQAEFYQTLGGIYEQLGDFDRADTLLQRALDQRRMLFGSDHPDVARSLLAMGRLRAAQSKLEEAELFAREGLAVSQHWLPSDHPTVAEAWYTLGRVMTERGNYEQSIEILEEAVRRSAVQDSANMGLSQSLTELANAHFYAGHYDAADSLNRRVLKIDRRLYGERHPLVANSLVNLGAVQFQVGHYEKAEHLYRQALEIKQGYFGADHYETAATLLMLGQSLTYQGRYEEALEVLHPALAIRERTYGAVHPRVASALSELGSVALMQDDLQAAEGYYTRMVTIYRTIYPDGHYYIGVAQSNLASVYLNGKDYQRAEPLFREAIEQFTTTLSADHLQTAIARIKLGRTLVRQERYAEAEAHLLAGYKVLSEQASPSVSWLRTAREDLVVVYEALNRLDEATHFRKEAERT